MRSVVSETRFRKLSKEVCALLLPSSVYEEGVGEVSIFEIDKIIGYRPRADIGAIYSERRRNDRDYL